VGEANRPGMLRSILEPPDQVGKSSCIAAQISGIIRGMKSILFALLVLSLVGAPAAQAQKAGGGFHGGPAGAPSGSPGMPGHGPNFGGRPGNSHFHHRGFNRFQNYGSVVLPWYYPYWDDFGEYYFEPQVNPPAPPTPAAPAVIVLDERNQHQQPKLAPESPKLIEVPETKEVATSAKPVPPALFVLTSGQRLEAHQYMLTAEALHLEVDRQRRTIPLSELNLDATIAANHERGINLMIPTNRSVVFLGF